MKEARAEAQTVDVAVSHVSLIKMFWFVFVRSANVHISLVNSMFLVHYCCPHTRIAEAISVSAIELIQSIELII